MKRTQGKCPVTPTLGLHVAQVGWDSGTLSWAFRAADGSGILLIQKRKSTSSCHTCVSEPEMLVVILCNYFDLLPRSLAIKEFFSKPKYNHILKPEDCLSEPCTILQLDMRTVQVADLEVRRERFLPRQITRVVNFVLLVFQSLFYV